MARKRLVDSLKKKYARFEKGGQEPQAFLRDLTYIFKTLKTGRYDRLDETGTIDQALDNAFTLTKAFPRMIPVWHEPPLKTPLTEQHIVLSRYFLQVARLVGGHMTASGRDYHAEHRILWLSADYPAGQVCYRTGSPTGLDEDPNMTIVDIKNRTINGSKKPDSLSPEALFKLSRG